MYSIRSTLKIALVAFGICTVIVMVVLVLPPDEIKIATSKQGSIGIGSASFLTSLFGFTNKISYQANGISGNIAIWQDLTSRPLLVEALPDTNSFLCLYKWDGDLRLMRINPDKPFVTTANLENEVSTNVICSSPWEVQNATIQDWRLMETFLTNLTAIDLTSKFVQLSPLNFNLTRHLSLIVAGVQMRVGLMTEYGANTWPMLTTRRYPITTNAVTNGAPKFTK